MEVTIRVLPEVAQALHHHQPVTNKTRELMAVAAELGITLEPVHPGIDDVELMRYFAVSVPDHAAAAQVIQRLRSCVAVDAAYVKPPDELP